MSSNKAPINIIENLSNDFCSTSTFSKKFETSNNTQMNNSSFNEITSYYQSPLMQNLVTNNQYSKSNQLSNRYNNSNNLKEQIPNNKNQTHNMYSNTQSSFIPQLSEYPIQTFQNKENIPTPVKGISLESGTIHSFGNLQTSQKKQQNHLSSSKSGLKVQDLSGLNGQQNEQHQSQIQENCLIQFNRSKSFHGNDQYSLNQTNMQGIQASALNQNNQKNFYAPQDQAFNNPLSNNNNINQQRETNNSTGFKTSNLQSERMNDYIQKLNFVSNQNMAKSSNMKMFAQTNIENIPSNFHSYRSTSQQQRQISINQPSTLHQSTSQKQPSVSQHQYSLQNNFHNQNQIQNKYNQLMNTQSQSIHYQQMNQTEQIQYQQNCIQIRDGPLKERILNLDMNNLSSNKNINNNNKEINQNMNKQYKSKSQVNLTNFYQQNINQQIPINQQYSQSNNVNQMNQQNIQNQLNSRSQQNIINQQNQINLQSSKNDQVLINYSSLNNKNNNNNNQNQVAFNSCNINYNNDNKTQQIQQQNILQINQINQENRNIQKSQPNNQSSLQRSKSPTKHILHKIFNQSGRFFEDLKSDQKDQAQQKPGLQNIENKILINQQKLSQKDENQKKNLETLLIQPTNNIKINKKKSTENVSNCLAILEISSDDIQTEEIEQNNYKSSSRDLKVVNHQSISEQQKVTKKSNNLYLKDQNILFESTENLKQQNDDDKLYENSSKLQTNQNKCNIQQLSSIIFEDNNKALNHKQYKKQLLENIVKELEKDKSFENICKKNYQTLKSNEKRHASKENLKTPFNIPQDHQQQNQDQIKQTSAFNHENYDKQTQESQEVVKLQKIIDDLQQQNAVLMQNQQVQNFIRLQSQMMKQEAQIKLLQKELKIQKNLNQNLEDKLEMYLNSTNFNSVRNV